MKKLLILLTIFIVFSINPVSAGKLFDMDFSDNPQQAQILSEHDAVILQNKGIEWGSIIINKIHGQNVDLSVFSSFSKKLIAFNTINAADQILQVDINKDELADFVIDIQSPIKNNEVILIVKKLFEDTETPTTTTKEDTSKQITGEVINPPKETKLNGFLIMGLIVIIGLVGYYIFIHKKR